MEKLSSSAKLFTFLQVLYDLTDEEHPKTREELEEALLPFGITLNRKTFYNYIETLQSVGIDIHRKKTDHFRYYVASRHFDFAESKLLIDAVQSSNFINKEKSEALIEKISKLNSLYQAANLKRKLYMSERSKSLTKNIYQNVDVIFEAIVKNKKISFRYFDFYLDVNHQKKKRFRKDGKQYVASPYSLVWAQDNYYVVSYFPEHEGLSNFRIDRMDHIVILDEKRVNVDVASGVANFNISRYSQNIFSMFSGKTQTIVLKCDNDLLSAAIDRFGFHASMKRDSDDCFVVEAAVQVSPTFYAWLFQFHEKVQLLSPTDAVNGYKEYLDKVSQMYR